MRDSTQSQPMGGISQFGNLEGTCADQRLTEVTQGNRGVLMSSRPAEAVPKKAAKSVQRLVSNYSATLRFSMIFLSCKANFRI
jgi:hypothetical protein